jgi:hypothetical protein
VPLAAACCSAARDFAILARAAATWTSSLGLVAPLITPPRSFRQSSRGIAGLEQVGSVASRGLVLRHVGVGGSERSSLSMQRDKLAPY